MKDYEEQLIELIIVHKQLSIERLLKALDQDDILTPRIKEIADIIMEKDLVETPELFKKK